MPLNNDIANSTNFDKCFNFYSIKLSKSNLVFHFKGTIE